MPLHPNTHRQLKKRIRRLLERETLDEALATIEHLPARRVVNPLFSFLCSLDENLRWRSITAMGSVVASLAERDPESARVVMRRFIWNLNDESGGIGWGCPEAMAESMARSEAMACEYACILLSYIQPEGNYLEHESLQDGVLWGIGRLARERPERIRGCERRLLTYLQSSRVMHRALAAYALGALYHPEMKGLLGRLVEDRAAIRLYRDQQMIDCTVADLAREALDSQCPASCGSSPRI